MDTSTAQAQAESEPEPRNDGVKVAVTASEKRAIRAIAAVHGTSESELLRIRAVANIVEEFTAIQQRSRESVARTG